MKSFKIRKFQQGGSPDVYTPQFQVGQGGISPNMAPIMQAASMPVESGLNGYIQTKQLDISEEQVAMQAERLVMETDKYEFEKQMAEIKAMNTISDDFFGIEILSRDQEEYATILDESGLNKAMEAGDVSGMAKAGLALKANPKFQGVMARKVHSDNQLELVQKIPAEQRPYSNAAGVLSDIMAGKEVREFKFDQATYDTDRQLQMEGARAKLEADTLRAKADAEAIPQEIAIKQQQANIKQQQANIQGALQGIKSADFLTSINANLSPGMEPLLDIANYAEWASTLTPEQLAKVGESIKNSTNEAINSFSSAQADVYKRQLAIYEKAGYRDAALMAFRDIQKVSTNNYNTNKTTTGVNPTTGVEHQQDVDIKNKIALSGGVGSATITKEEAKEANSSLTKHSDGKWYLIIPNDDTGEALLEKKGLIDGMFTDADAVLEAGEYAIPGSFQQGSQIYIPINTVSGGTPKAAGSNTRQGMTNGNVRGGNTGGTTTPANPAAKNSAAKNSAAVLDQWGISKSDATPNAPITPASVDTTTTISDVDATVPKEKGRTSDSTYGFPGLIEQNLYEQLALAKQQLEGAKNSPLRDTDEWGKTNKSKATPHRSERKQQIYTATQKIKELEKEIGLSEKAAVKDVANKAKEKELLGTIIEEIKTFEVGESRSLKSSWKWGKGIQVTRSNIVGSTSYMVKVDGIGEKEVADLGALEKYILSTYTTEYVDSLFKN